MKKPTIYSSMLLFLAMLATGCHERNATPCSSDESAVTAVTKVRYGTSFGMCAGYCKHEITVTRNVVKFEKSGWTGTVVPVTCQKQSDNCALLRKINMGTFFKLDEIIGCPDCADGGAEWIEIETPSKKYKVTFPYHDEPAAVGGYIEDLRELLAAMDCK